MKTIPPPCLEPEVGPKYWRSLDQLADSPDFKKWVEKEFPAGASEFTDPVSRRHFVKIMSASFLLGGLGLTGCRRPEETIQPFSKTPEGYIHGVPQFYATARPTRGSAIPLLVKSSEGRPTKVEGNPQFPDGNGGTDTFTQASILNLYDPDRAMRFAKGGSGSTRDAAFDFLGELSKRFQANGGEGLSFLIERNSSPSRARLQKIISEKLPKAQWHIYEPIDFNVHSQAASLATGQAVAPEFHLEKAKRILSLDCDFIGSEEDTYRNIRGFAKGRKLATAEDDMSRLYVVEGLFTQTGANADERLRVPTSQVLAVAAKLAQEISKDSLPSEITELANSFKGDAKSAKWISECAKDLVANAKESVVLAGYRQPLAVHIIANVLNSALGSEAVVFRAHSQVTGKSIDDLAKSLGAGEVDTLVILGGNPVYNAPAELNFAAACKKAKTVVRLGYYEDETFAVSTWHLPAAHYLESWGDVRTSDGTLAPVQPLIEPLFGGLTEIEVLARISGEGKTRPHDIVRETFKEISKATDFEGSWKKFLHDGFLDKSASRPMKANNSTIGEALKNLSSPTLPGAQNLEVVFHRDYKVDDGRYTNNGWLQELPDPVTKMTWENVVLISQKTADDLGLKIHNNEDNRLVVPVVKIQIGNRQIEGPIWIQPGQADNTIGLALGYGRTQTGRVGNGSGYDAYKLRTAASPYIAVGAKLTSTGKTHPLATTQDHGAMEGRPIIREANLEQFKKNPKFAEGMDMEAPPGGDKPLYPNPLDKLKEKALHQWGMSIDLNSCVGCSACVVACQSENNIPIVGKQQVRNNREMHWIRIDRYYAGAVTEPQMIHQPMLCQHCESAPCENVCPVNATSHDEEGLNVMTYNRCVGTRYCSNNCPYKVRRFNFFDYNKRPLDQLYKSPLDPRNRNEGEWELLRWFKDVDKSPKPADEWELLKLVKNPDVSVRMRGVMEKCSFCLQRIEQAKISQKVKAGASGDIRLTEKEGTIPKTACQQACPAEAIVFGDVSDSESQVSKLKTQERDYTVLEFLLTKPRLTYLARVRNPNPGIDQYKEMPASYKEFIDKNGHPFEEVPHSAHGEKHSSEPVKKGAH